MEDIIMDLLVLEWSEIILRVEDFPGQVIEIDFVRKTWGKAKGIITIVHFLVNRQFIRERILPRYAHQGE